MRTLDKVMPMRSVWLAIIFCLGLALPAYAATIFSEDYEVNALSDLQAKGWTCLPSSCTGATTDIVTTTRLGAPAYSGSHMLRQTYAGVHVDDCCNSWIMKTWTGVPEIWERYYVRYEAIDPLQSSGFSSITAKQHFFNVGTRPTLISTYLFNAPEFAYGYNTPTGVQVICPGTTFLDSTCNLRQNLTTVSTTHDTWFCIESHLSQTAVETWVNSTPTMSRSGSWYTAPALWTNVQIYRQGSDNLYRYEDDYVVSTTRVGCASGDVTPPSTPANLRIVSVFSNRIDLAWDASTDNVGVTGYIVERVAGGVCSGFSQIGTMASVSYSDIGILTNTAYCFRVRATDAANNLSAYSANISQTTDTVKFHPALNLRRIFSDIQDYLHRLFTPPVRVASHQEGVYP